jgi:tetratricopeptide (TPR) repeat protein
VTAGKDWKEDIRKGNSEFYVNRNYPKAEGHYKDALRKDPGNVAALVNLSFLHSEYIFKFDDESLKIPRQITEIRRGSESTSNLAERLIQAGKYEEALQRAEEVISTPPGSDRPYPRDSDFLNIHTLDHSGYQVLNRFFKLCSYMLKGDDEMSDKALEEFITYYRGLGNEFRIKDEQWIFNGLVKAIAQSPRGAMAKFLLYLLIDLLAGKRNAMDITRTIPS